MLTEPTHLRIRDQPRQQVVGDPADAARGRPRQYTVYADEPLVLPARPARLVVRAALRVRQDLTRLEMGEQVHEAHLGARALELGRGSAIRRLIRASALGDRERSL